MKKIFAHILTQGLLLLLVYMLTLGAAGFEENGRHPIVALLVIVYITGVVALYGFIETIYKK